MASDLTGINNHNEYFTNHYFSAYLGDGKDKIVSKIASQGLNVSPWSKLRELGKYYSQIHDKLQSSESFQKENIPDFADKLLDLLGYKEADLEPVVIEGMTLPLYSTSYDEDGNPRVCIMLSLIGPEDGILDGHPFSIDVLGRKVEYTKDCSCALDDLFYKNTNAPRWTIVIGIEEIALIDRERWGERRYLSFDLLDVFGRHEDSTYKTICALLYSSSLVGKDGKCDIDDLIESSLRNASGVSQDLKYALRESIEILGNEVIYDQIHRLGRDVETDPIDASQLSLECLRYMYRMLFVLFIESRPELGYAPVSNLPYMQGYSLEHLRDLAENVRDDKDNVEDGYYLHDTLSKLFDIMYTGYPANKEERSRLQSEESLSDIFVLEPLKAHIFDPEYTPLITSSKLRNSAMKRIIKLMSLTRSGGNNSRPGRISYSALGINQMGAVYEALLSYRGFIADDKLYEVKPADDKTYNELSVGYFVKESELNQYNSETEYVRNGDGSPKCYEKGTFIYRRTGRERENSASYYTPESLTKTLVKYSLKELLENKTADEILDLTICEPAMGSAAFLNETINQLAEAYLSKKQKEVEESIPYDEYKQQLQRVKMYIADKNVYGVDLNPVAVELAEVSLWLNTICRDEENRVYIPWFGTQLANGNSLIGARRQCYKVEDLQSDRAPLIWYSHKPERILPKSSRNVKKQIYHFLTSDPGMSNYTDKTFKQFYPEELKKLTTWRKNFTAPYNSNEIATMLRLSEVIDDLWNKQVELRHEITNLTSDTLSIWKRKDTIHNIHTTIREKDKIYRDTYLSEKMQNAGPYARLKFAMDYWCSLWFWPIDQIDYLPTREQFLFDMSYILSGGIGHVRITPNARPTNKANAFQMTLMPTEVENMARSLINKYEAVGNVDLQALCNNEPRLAIARDIAKKYSFIHWELEFADIFEDKGGFDLIIGNPPWLKVEWKEQNLLSEHRPILGIRKVDATDIVPIRADLLEDSKLKSQYFSELISTSGMQNYYGSIQNYPELEGMQSNLYKCFLPLSWRIGNNIGLSAFIHLDGIFDDPNGASFRKIVYPKLKQHYHFINERHLFADVGGTRVFSLNIYCNKPSKKVDFVMIGNLFDPSTIDQCYGTSNLPMKGLKDENGEWTITGHPNRLIHINDTVLSSFAKMFDEDPKGTHLLVVHSKQLLSSIEKFSSAAEHFSELSPYPCEMWHVTNSVNDGTIDKKTQFTREPSLMIFAGPNIGLGNPLFKTPRRVCKEKNHYDIIRLTEISDDYVPRCNYVPKGSIEKYNAKIPKTDWGTSYTDLYRIIARKMLDTKQVRTLNPAILPPRIGHVNGLLGFALKNEKDVVTNAGLWASIPYDFLIKAIGKQNLNMDNAKCLPVFNNSPLVDEICYRTLKLNCVSPLYGRLLSMFDFSNLSPSWSKEDSRLQNDFNIIKNTWDSSFFLKNDYERRQALVEIDVLTSMLLKLTLEELITIYSIQFPTVQKYEKDTWYDSKGLIVFTNDQGLPDVGLERKDWEQSQKSGPSPITETINSDIFPDGPRELVITHEPPYIKCDRVEDYRTAWNYFATKYGVKK